MRITGEEGQSYDNVGCVHIPLNMICDRLRKRPASKGYSAWLGLDIQGNEARLTRVQGGVQNTRESSQLKGGCRRECHIFVHVTLVAQSALELSGWEKTPISGKVPSS